jgi:uncharacterized protein
MFSFLCIYLTPKLLQIPTSYSIDQFQPTNSVIMETDDHIRETFYLSKELPLIADVRITGNGTWLSQERLKYLAKLTNDIKKIDGVKSATSIATVDTAVPDQGSFYIGSLKEVSLNSQDKEDIFRNPLLTPNFLSKDGKNASLLIELKRSSFQQQEKTLKNIHYFLNHKSKLIAAEIGGPAAITISMSNLVSKEAIACTLISLLVSILFFFLLFKNPSVIAVSSIVVIYSNVLGLAMLWLFGLKLTVLTCTVPTLITLTVVAISVQIFSRISEHRNKVLKKHKHILVLKTILGIARSSFLASLSTAIGFLTLLFSNTPIMREYGLAVSSSILMASTSCLLLLWCLLLWIPIPEKRKIAMTAPKMLIIVYAYKKQFLISIAATCSILLLFGNFLNWSVRLFDDLPQEQATVQATYQIEQSFGGSLPLDIVITAQEKGFWKKRVNLKKLDDLKATFLSHPGIGSFVTVTDMIKQTSLTHQMPTSQQAVAESFFIYSMAQENPMDKLVNTNHTATRVALRVYDLPSKENEQLITGLVLKAQNLFPTAKITKGGTAATVHKLNENLSKELIHGAFYALFMIFILMIVVFKSVRWALVAVIPNLLTPIFLLGILGMTSTPIKPTLAIVFAISLGIAFDNTIYVLSKLKKLLSEKPHRLKLPILKLMREEFMPCLIASSATIAGFSVFLFSHFSINTTFGIFMILSVGIALVGDLVLLPVLLHFAPGLLLKPIKTEKILGCGDVILRFKRVIFN